MMSIFRKLTLAVRKSRIQSFFSWGASLLGSFSHKLNPARQLCYAQEGEDRVLSRFFSGKNKGFYVDVGAHHPHRFSNTQFFYELGWNGVNIEPSPIALKYFLRERKRDVNLNIGISEASGILDYYVFDEPALNTFDTNLALAREKQTSYRLVDKMTIPVDRLDNILSKYMPENQEIDFLSIDVEGLDLQVLKSNNWNLFRPKMVLVEALDLGAVDILSSLKSNPVDVFMREVGYKFVAKTFNTIFYRDAKIGD